MAELFKIESSAYAIHYILYVTVQLNLVKYVKV